MSSGQLTFRQKGGVLPPPSSWIHSPYVSEDVDTLEPLFLAVPPSGHVPQRIEDRCSSKYLSANVHSGIICNNHKIEANPDVYQLTNG